MVQEQQNIIPLEVAKERARRLRKSSRLARQAGQRLTGRGARTITGTLPEEDQGLIITEAEGQQEGLSTPVTYDTDRIFRPQTPAQRNLSERRLQSFDPKLASARATFEFTPSPKEEKTLAKVSPNRLDNRKEFSRVKQETGSVSDISSGFKQGFGLAFEEVRNPSDTGFRDVGQAAGLGFALAFEAAKIRLTRGFSRGIAGSSLGKRTSGNIATGFGVPLSAGVATDFLTQRQRLVSRTPEERSVLDDPSFRQDVRLGIESSGGLSAFSSFFGEKEDFEQGFIQARTARGVSRSRAESELKLANFQRNTFGITEITSGLQIERAVETFGRQVSARALSGAGVVATKSGARRFGQSVGKRIAVPGASEGVAQSFTQSISSGFGAPSPTDVVSSGVFGAVSAGTISSRVAEKQILGQTGRGKATELLGFTVDPLEKPGDILADLTSGPSNVNVRVITPGSISSSSLTKVGGVSSTLTQNRLPSTSEVQLSNFLQTTTTPGAAPSNLPSSAPLSSPASTPSITPSNVPTIAFTNLKSPGIPSEVPNTTNIPSTVSTPSSVPTATSVPISTFAFTPEVPILPLGKFGGQGSVGLFGRIRKTQRNLPSIQGVLTGIGADIGSQKVFSGIGSRVRKKTSKKAKRKSKKRSKK